MSHCIIEPSNECTNFVVNNITTGQIRRVEEGKKKSSATKKKENRMQILFFATRFLLFPFNYCRIFLEEKTNMMKSLYDTFLSNHA